MKKIFSLLCAMMLVLSASAAPFAAKKVAKQTISARPAVGAVELAKLNRSEVRATKAAFPHKATSIKVQAPARTQDVSITFDDCEAWSYESYYEDGSWDLELYNGEDYVGFLAIMGDCDGTHICGTYDIEDAIDGYPGARFIINGDTINAVSGSFEITYVSTDGGIPTYNVSGSLVCDNGETVVLDNDFPVPYAIDYYSYMLYYYGYAQTFDFIELEDAPFVPTGDTISVVIPGKCDIMYFAADNDYYFMGHNDEYSISLDLLASGADLESGHYTLSNGDFWAQYCGIYDVTTSAPIASLVDLEADINVTPDTTFLTAWYTLKDGNVYQVEAKYYILTATDTVEVYIDGYVYDFTATLGAFQLMTDSTRTDYELSIAVEAENAYGTFTDEDNYIDAQGYNYTGLTVNGEAIGFENFTITLAQDGTAIVEYLGKDAILYIFYVNQTPTALKNVDAVKVTKAIKNGQLVIEKNGVKFNAQGMKL